MGESPRRNSTSRQWGWVFGLAAAVGSAAPWSMIGRVGARAAKAAGKFPRKLCPAANAASRYTGGLPLVHPAPARPTRKTSHACKSRCPLSNPDSHRRAAVCLDADRTCAGAKRSPRHASRHTPQIGGVEFGVQAREGPGAARAHFDNRSSHRRRFRARSAHMAAGPALHAQTLQARHARAGYVQARVHGDGHDLARPDRLGPRRNHAGRGAGADIQRGSGERRARRVVLAR